MSIFKPATKNLTSLLLPLAYLAATIVGVHASAEVAAKGPPSGTMCKNYTPQNPTARCELLFYSDAHCTQQIYDLTMNVDPALPYGCGSCGIPYPQGAPLGTVYVKTGNNFFPPDRLFVLSNVDDCPSWGPTNYLTDIRKSDQCIQIGSLNANIGFECFPNGCNCGTSQRRGLDGGNTTDVLVPREASDAKCTGFSVTRESKGTTRAQHMSDLIDCRNAPAPCSAAQTKQHSVTVTSDLSLNAGGSVGGLDIGAVFGSQYSDSYTTGTTNTQTIPVGQCGFLTGAGVADIKVGTFTGCGGPDQPGIATLAYKDQPYFGFATTTCP